MNDGSKKVQVVQEWIEQTVKERDEYRSSLEDIKAKIEYWHSNEYQLHNTQHTPTGLIALLYASACEGLASNTHMEE